MMETEVKTKKKRNPLLAFNAVISTLSLCCSLTVLCLFILYLVKPGIFTKPQGSVEAGTIINTETGAHYTEEELLVAISDAREEGSAEARAILKNEIKNMYMNATSIVQELRLLYPDDIVYYSDGRYRFVPIDASIPAFPYDKANLQADENGEIAYYEGDKVTSVKGIDVSKYQGEIDWEKVAESGVEFAIIRAGIRGYGTGEIVEDATFQDNLKGATDAGIDVGVYFFSQAITEEEAIEEANFILEAISDYDVTYPIALDVEEVTDKSARTNGLTATQRTDCAVAFLETIREAGYTPMIYGNLKSFCDMLELERVQDYQRWFAFYDKELYFPYDIAIWQYSDSGVIDGIEGTVDLNIMFEPTKWDHP